MFAESSWMSSYKNLHFSGSFANATDPSGREMEGESLKRGPSKLACPWASSACSPGPRKKPGRLRGHPDLACELKRHPLASPTPLVTGTDGTCSVQGLWDSNPPWHHKESEISTCNKRHLPEESVHSSPCQ